MFTQTRPNDSTALERQNRRLKRLKEHGVTRSTVFVHEDCKLALDQLRPHLIDEGKSQTLIQLIQKIEAQAKPINVAQVRHLSPFRYPGGKTWLVPQIRNWLNACRRSIDVFVEPFAGGAIAGLTVAAEGLAYTVALSELDTDVSSVWTLIFDGNDRDVTWLRNQILGFTVNLKNVQSIISSEPKTLRDRAFRTVIKNRMQRGGIMAAGAGLVKAGEAGRGLGSRWYPETLAKRIEILRSLRDRVSFLKCDAFQAIEQFSHNPRAFFFIDPPYTAGGKKAGSRLYEHSEVDHQKLFAVMAAVQGSALLTYDDTPEVRKLAAQHDFQVISVPMKNTHHAIMSELVLLKS
jgi:DNA adenine methylase